MRVHQRIKHRIWLYLTVYCVLLFLFIQYGPPLGAVFSNAKVDAYIRDYLPESTIVQNKRYFDISMFCYVYSCTDVDHGFDFRFWSIPYGLSLYHDYPFRKWEADALSLFSGKYPQYEFRAEVGDAFPYFIVWDDSMPLSIDECDKIPAIVLYVNTEEDCTSGLSNEMKNLLLDAYHYFTDHFTDNALNDVEIDHAGKGWLRISIDEIQRYIE